jgi:hypothetical protein
MWRVDLEAVATLVTALVLVVCFSWCLTRKND